MCGVDQRLRRPQRLRRGDTKVHARQCRRLQQREAAMLARIPQEGQAHLRQQLAWATLLHRHAVGQDLCRVDLVALAVVDRHAGPARQLARGGVVEAAVVDRVVQAAEHAHGVLHARPCAGLGVAGADDRDLRALVAGRDLERTVRAPGGVLVEQQGDVLAAQLHLLGAGVLGALQFVRHVEQDPYVAHAEFVQGQNAAILQFETHR